MFRKGVVIAAIALATSACAAGVLADVSGGSTSALQKSTSSASARGLEIDVGSAPPPVRTKGPQTPHRTTYRWKLIVRPSAATTYIAEVTAQRLCFFPASRCAHAHGQVWANAKTRPFTVRIRQEGSR